MDFVNFKHILDSTSTNILLKMKKKHNDKHQYHTPEIEIISTSIKTIQTAMKLLPNTVTFVPTTVKTMPLITQTYGDVVILIKFGSVRNCNKDLSK